MYKQFLLTCSLSLALCPLTGFSKDNSDISLSGGSGNINVDYTGNDTRIGIGINNEGKVSGEILQTFAEKKDSAYIAEGWYESGGAGGIKLNYHWLAEDMNRVYKAFAAVDQNSEKDRKASLGGGIESEKLFFSGYLSRSISDERETSNTLNKTNKLLTGSDNFGKWQQSQTISTITRHYAQAYDYGIGLRIGRYFMDELWRLRLGTDYEWGDYDSDQLTYSLGLETFIAGTGHSIALDIEHAEQSGEFQNNNSDTRSMLSWRYNFGNKFRKKLIASGTAKTSNNAISSSTNSINTENYRIVKHQVDMNSDTYFDKNSATLRNKHLDDIKKIAKIISQQKIIGKISLVGHTCDLGNASYNRKLSEQRANSVRRQLINLGVTDDLILIEGRGETQPKFANDSETNRSFNRRVDINFLLLNEQQELIPQKTTGKPIWKTEIIKQASPWYKRAVVNPIKHKRRVDTYQFETSQSSIENGDIVYTNHRPSALNDSATVDHGGRSTLIDVLANDSDEDGDALTIISVTQPATGGSVENFGNLVSFTSGNNFSGNTEFKYVIDDGQGGQSEATVQVILNNNQPTAVDDRHITPMLPAITVNVLKNDSDPDGDSLTVTRLDGLPDESIGIFNINSDNSITLVPTGWNGLTPLNINYYIIDGFGGSDSALLTIIDP